MGKTWDFPSLNIGCTIPHIVSDAMLLILPMPLDWILQMRRSQRVMKTAEPASEMETSEHALELESQRPIAELEGITRMSPLLQRTVRQE